MGSVCGKCIGNSSCTKSELLPEGGATSAGSRRPPPFSMCVGSLKLDDMVMSDAAVELTAQRLIAPRAEVIVWLETDTCMEAHASWRQLATRLEAAGYKCFLDGGQCDDDGKPTPLVDMVSKKPKTDKVTKKKKEDREGSKGKGVSRFTAFLLAVRSELYRDCWISPEIQAEVNIGSGAKGMLQRSLSVRGATIVLLGTSYSSKDHERDRQMRKLCSDATASSTIMKWMNQRQLAVNAAVTLQRRWRGRQARSQVTWMRRCIGNVSRISASHPTGNAELFPRVTPRPARYTFVCFGDQNMRVLSQDGWSRPEPGGASSLTPEAVDNIVELLRSQQGRMQLLEWVEVESAALSGFYDKTHWWRECGGTIGIPTYKRTPYLQEFPVLAQHIEGKPLVITTEELLKHARDSGDASLVQKVEILADTESKSYIGAEPALLQRQFFGMRDTVPVSKATSDAAQTFLKENAEGENVYIQLGWLDTLSFGQGRFTNFQSQEFRSFEVVPQVHAFDHLLTIGLLDFKP